MQQGAGSTFCFTTFLSDSRSLPEERHREEKEEHRSEAVQVKICCATDQKKTEKKSDINRETGVRHLPSLKT